MNQFSITQPPSNTLWYTTTTPMDHQQQHQQHKPFPLLFSVVNPNDDVSDNTPTSSSNTPIDNNNNNNNNPCETTTSALSQQQREPMFEKPLTPSDVGKLNRLVIPKQHAEKFFPLATGNGGLLLGFEDETGKDWRFRYSYWNSSQSYVLTKGWSRYVKEKKLDAGDVVLFDRHPIEADRFFIGWRRRRTGFPVRTNCGQYSWLSNTTTTSSVNAMHVRHCYPAPLPHRITAAFHCRPSTVDHHTNLHAATSQNGGNLKKVRLFGVNLECQSKDDLESQHSNGSCLSSPCPSPGLVQDFGSSYTGYGFELMGYPLNHHYNHLGMKFTQDMNHMKNKPG